ncbi:flagellin N-terminal helical domain-containing protein [Oribacterium sp. WCC10]|uniref:flagellin N-terminal helical domain-containing protein n=1 Tax=Oribacterium sp. WCC10 TaxID=1855343 RepID=UPI0008EB5EF5|nr:flagellin [Oribacterium sp. WCC10]SFG24280.1 flagellin [Oribacterium sp. WCC10]
MVIQHNIAAIDSYRNLSQNTGNLNKNLEKLSSGFKINRAGDDAAGLAISESMRNKINALNQAEDNANDAIGLIQTAEGALTETHQMLERMTTLATQAANGTYATAADNDGNGDTTARLNIQAEIDELKSEIDRIASSTEYNGIKILTHRNTKQFQIGTTSGEILKLRGSTMQVSALGNSNLRISAISVMTVSAANSAIDAIKKAVNQVSSYRAQLGAKQNRLEHTINNLKVNNENTTSAESRIRDTDMAKEISAYTKNNILNQAAQSMLAQANQQPQAVLSLLQG